jgi:N-acyl homoserine lactone hydrolase
MQWTVYPLIPSEIVIEMGRLTYMRNYGKTDFFPCPFFVLKSGEAVVLVDTSGCKKVMQPMRVEPVRDRMSFDEALKGVGLSPDKIQTVIFTHLMYDHCANAPALPDDARLIVQKKELEYALDPHPLFAGAYQTQLFEGRKFDLLEGDAEILPGLRVMFTPGHSAGCQSVLVNTSQGLVGITGFCCIDDNFSPSEGAWSGADAPQVIPPGIHLDMQQAYDSALRFQRAADIILPMHGKSLLDIRKIPA